MCINIAYYLCRLNYLNRVNKELAISTDPDASIMRPTPLLEVSLKTMEYNYTRYTKTNFKLI